MTDLSTARLKNLIDQASPGPWTVEENKWDEVIVGNRAGHDLTLGDQVRFLFEAGNPKADTEIAAASIELAHEVLRMRRELGAMRDAWLGMIADPDCTPVEQNFATHVVDHIDSVLGNYND